jgi:hypothetical protein
MESKDQELLIFKNKRRCTPGGLPFRHAIIAMTPEWILPLMRDRRHFAHVLFINFNS